MLTTFAKQGIAVLLYACLLSTAQAVAEEPNPENPLPTDQPRKYFAISNHTDFLFGDLTLSRSLARIAKLKGTMELLFDGIAPKSKDTDFSGAQVFKIVNGEKYSQLNKGKNGFWPCHAKWFTVRELDGNRGIGGDIRICIMNIDDWREYKPTVIGLCSCDSYELYGSSR